MLNARNIRLALLTSAAIALSASGAMAGLSVSGSSDATTLLSTILGSGITVVGTPTYIGATNQSGSFSGGASAGIGIDTGLLLTNGSINNAVGPNTSDGASTGIGSAGDADLSALTGGTTNDAASLSFTFQFGDGSTGGDLFFSYVFASEEYNEFVNQFNDPFALFVDGKNIALAPDGNPVTVNNVSCGNPYNAATVGTNCGSFNNNDLQDGGPFFDIQYDGFTDVFTAQALGLSAGTHTMKFAIADAGDTALDSGVFIKGGSFSTTPPDDTAVPEPVTFSLFGAGLVGAAALRRRKAKKA
jgi:hypothetical protein